VHSGPDNLRLVLGLKVRARRDAKGWTLQELSRQSGLAISYLSEIEKGRKYPKPEKLLDLARALGIAFQELVSPRVEDELSPLSAFAGSEFLREFPFELFGLEAGDLFDLISTDPKRAGALLRTFGDIARRHDLEVEQFLFGALRSFQQLHGNHFPEIEEAADRFREAQGWRGGGDKGLEADLLEVLERRYGFRVDLEVLAARRELATLRSVYAAGATPMLYLNGRLSSAQRAFAMAREIGYRELGLGERAVTGSWLRAETFDQVLNNFKASYFAGALLLPRQRLLPALERFFGEPRFRAQALVELVREFAATPEMLFYRISQLAPVHFGLTDLFFVRFFRDTARRRSRLTKVLNLASVTVPYGVSPEEHSCRRWPGVSIFEAPGLVAATSASRPPVAAARCRFQSEPVEFLVLAMARPLSLQPKTHSSVSLGFRVDARLAEVVRFLDDRSLRRLEVDLTCERCPLPAARCAERAAAPSVLDAQRQLERQEAAIAELLGAAAAPAQPTRLLG
jgi:transcriptional regulator with XRE-family HTH domain/Zn-dependent peptidase ImmA (M78 family)